MKGRYSEAWELPPKMSRLTHGVGIVSMGYIMDTVSYRLAGSDHSIPKTEQFAHEIGATRDGDTVDRGYLGVL